MTVDWYVQFLNNPRQ